MPPDVEVKPGWDAFIKSMQWHGAQALEWGSLATAKSISANYPSSTPNRQLNQGSVSLFITEL
jgi:hypothetical protein